MSHDDKTPGLGRFDYGIVRRKVRQIVGRAGFKKQDAEDLEHQLLARLLHSLKSFDPARAHRNAFVTTVIERYVANVLRDKKAEKRDHKLACSLSVIIGYDDDDEPIELGETISQPEYDARRRRQPRSDEELAQLASDMADVLAKAPGELGELAEQIKSGKSISQIAREKGIPPTTLYESVRKLRRRFEQAGLKDYL